MMDIFIFNVGLGQCIFLYPRNNPEYSLMIDCGHSEDCNPIEWLKWKGFFHNNELGQLIITNYDQDHFSNVEAFNKNEVKIRTVRLSDNMTSAEIKASKTVVTSALNCLIDIKERYTSTAATHSPPYAVYSDYLTDYIFQTSAIPDNTNNRSQVVFVEYKDSVIGIGGDLEKQGWEIITHNNTIFNLLKQTNVFVAPHHGRENGYCEEVFSICGCAPECIIISDKSIQHETQKGVVQDYAQYVDEGICLNGDFLNLRKVLTTRNDGNIWIRINEDGNRVYKTFSL